MEIILLRHGKPDFLINQKVRIRDVPNMVAGYNNSGVSQQPTKSAISMAYNCNYIVSSDLPRSIQSARLLGVDEIHLSSCLFREVDLPVSIWPSPKMSSYFWFGFFRLLWFMGHRASGESLTDARQRAQKAMQELMRLAQEHERVLFVGHGLLNQFIAKELLSYGWQGPGRAARDHWDYSAYEFPR